MPDSETFSQKKKKNGDYHFWPLSIAEQNATGTLCNDYLRKCSTVLYNTALDARETLIVAPYRAALSLSRDQIMFIAKYSAITLGITAAIVLIAVCPPIAGVPAVVLSMAKFMIISKSLLVLADVFKEASVEAIVVGFSEKVQKGFEVVSDFCKTASYMVMMFGASTCLADVITSQVNWVMGGDIGIASKLVGFVGSRLIGEKLHAWMKGEEQPEIAGLASKFTGMFFISKATEAANQLSPVLGLITYASLSAVNTYIHSKTELKPDETRLGELGSQAAGFAQKHLYNSFSSSIFSSLSMGSSVGDVMVKALAFTANAKIVTHTIEKPVKEFINSKVQGLKSQKQEAAVGTSPAVT